MASRPLLEASTPEEALVLAHAHYGPDAPVEVREVRTGGMLGFFATQRYVADLATPDGAPSVSGHADTVTREHDTDLDAGLDAAIAEASQTLGLPMSSPTRPVSSVSAGLLYDTRTSGAFEHPDRRRGEPTPGEEAVDASPAAPASPFAAALSRMTTEPVVTEAVMNALDDPAAPLSGVALYSVPAPALPADDVATAVTAPHATAQSIDDAFDALAPTGAPDGAAGPVEPHINYAAALVASRSRNPLFPRPPAPVTAAPSETAPVSAAPVQTVPAPVAEQDTAAARAVETAAAMTTAMAAAIPHASDPTGLLPRLDAAGFPVNRVPDLFLHEVGEKGIHTALTRLIKMRTSPAPALPVAPCTVVLIGPGTEALTAAMNACGALRADASQVAWVGPAHLSNLVPRARRISTPEAATEWLAAPKRATVVNVIAVHAPVSDNIDPHTRAMIAALDPTMVLAVVDATRRSDAVTRWVEALDCVDAIALENASDTPDPATWLTLPAAPVALVEGRKATAARWASLLCERLTDLTDLTDVEA